MNLEPAFVKDFNKANIPLLPTDTDYNAIAANADLDGSGRIDSLDEIDGLLSLPGGSLEAWVRAFADLSYQVVRGIQSVRVATNDVFDPVLGENIPVKTIVLVENETFKPNDLLVTTGSAVGEESNMGTSPGWAHESTLLGEPGIPTGNLGGRHHGNVGDDATADLVFGWILSADRMRGDLDGIQ